MSKELKIVNGRINFCCKGDLCRHNCCGPFEGVTKELSSIDNRPFDEIVLTPEDYDLFYENGYTDFVEEGYSPETGKKYHKMALEADGTCKALKYGRCSIHNIRPTLCRAFPFYFDMFSGLCAINCDGFTDEYWTDLEDYRSYFEAAGKMNRFWIDFFTSKGE